MHRWQADLHGETEREGEVMSVLMRLQPCRHALRRQLAKAVLSITYKISAFRSPGLQAECRVSSSAHGLRLAFHGRQWPTVCDYPGEHFCWLPASCVDRKHAMCSGCSRLRCSLLSFQNLQCLKSRGENVHFGKKYGGRWQKSAPWSYPAFIYTRSLQVPSSPADD